MKRKIQGILFKLTGVFYALIIIMLGSLLWADDASYEGDGATVFPISNDQIQMLHEKVVCNGGYKWYIEMTATYKNFGPETTVQMGFPFKQKLPEETDDQSLSDNFDPQFKTFVDGKSIPVIPKRSKEHPELKHINFPTAYTFEVHFAENEQKTIRHTYTAGGFASSIGDYHFSYILMTGALWKDKINRIEVEMRIYPTMGFDIVSPPEHTCRLDENDYQIILNWTYTDIEPDFNIEVANLGWFARNAPPDMQIRKSTKFINQYGKAGIRYLRNLIFAHYGYPFKNPMIRNVYYSPQAHLYTENENYSEKYISSYHLEFLEYLNFLDSQEENYSIEKLTIYLKEFPKLTISQQFETEPDSNLFFETMEWHELNFTLDRSLLLDQAYLKYGQIGLDYLRNLIFAHYGYPFKDPLYRETFYGTGRYSENDHYSEKMISRYHMEFAQKLLEMEKESK